MALELNIKTVNEVLAELRNLNLEVANIETIMELLGSLNPYIGVRQTIQQGTFVQRTVVLDNEANDYFPTEVQRISYNPRASSIGRCNLDGDAV